MMYYDIKKRDNQTEYVFRSLATDRILFSIVVTLGLIDILYINLTPTKDQFAEALKMVCSQIQKENLVPQIFIAGKNSLLTTFLKNTSFQRIYTRGRFSSSFWKMKAKKLYM